MVGCVPSAPVPVPGNGGGMMAAGNDGGVKGDMSEPAAPGAEPDPMLALFPKFVFTGFDGTHSYSVPLATSLTGALTWSTSDSALAQVVTVPNAKVPADLQMILNTQWGMLTAKKAGTGKVTVTAGAMTGTSDVTIAAYTAAQYQAGDTKYQATCAGCHSGPGGVDHSPTTSKRSESSPTSARCLPRAFSLEPTV